MKYATGADFRRALETRLRTLSQRDGAPLARLRKFIAFDRLLARLLYAEPGRSRSGATLGGQNHSFSAWRFCRDGPPITFG